MTLIPCHHLLLHFFAIEMHASMVVFLILSKKYVPTFNLIQQKNALVGFSKQIVLVARVNRMHRPDLCKIMV